MILFLSIYPLGILLFFAHFFLLKKQERTSEKFIELLLLYQIVFSLGLTSLAAFLGLTFLDEFIAQYTNWPSCPFQQQLANVNLAFFVLGILSIWYRGYFWAATIIGFSVWILSDGIQHLYHAWRYRNFSPGNIGVPLYTDFIIPIFLLILLYIYVKQIR